MGKIIVDIPELLNPDQAAEALGVGYATIWRWIRDNRLIPVRIGGRTLIPLSEIERLKANNNNASKEG